MDEERIIQIGNILSEARFRFAIESLNKVNQMKPKENFVFSPYSIYEMLLLVYFATSGDTEEKLKHILHLSGVHKSNLITCYLVRREYQVQPEYENINAFEAAAGYNDASIRLMIACWITNIKCLNVATLQNIFQDRFEAFNFRTYPTYIMHRINNTLTEEGKGHICDPGILTMIKENMEIILTNLLCVKTQEFQISSIYQRISANERKGRFKWMCKNFVSCEMNLHICELPYKNDNISLFVLLPEYCSRLDPKQVLEKYIIVNHMYEVLNELSTVEGIRQLRHWLEYNVTREESKNFVVWPTFELEKELPIHQLLQALGVEELVKCGGIDMSGFVAGDNQSLNLGSAVHRAHIKVTEEKAVAGAVTAFYTGSEFARPCQRVVCNSDIPFVWLIYDKLRRNVLFVGAFNEFDGNDSHLASGWLKASYGFF